MNYLRNLKKTYDERPFGYLSVLKKTLENTQSILDLGCGKYSPISNLDIKKKVGLDIYKPSIEYSRKNKIHHEYIHADVLNFTDFIKPYEFDTIFANDLVEHFDKEQSISLVKKMINYCGKSVVIFTPNGFVPQEPFDNNPFQEHKCGWDVSDYEQLGFKTVGINGAKFLRGELAIPRIKPRALGRLISSITEFYTYSRPQSAFHLLAVYTRK